MHIRSVIIESKHSIVTVKLFDARTLFYDSHVGLLAAQMGVKPNGQFVWL